VRDTGNEQEDDSPPPLDDRRESRAERLDRNTIELINELRVAGTGIQVLFAFLLVVPFNNRFTHLSTFERWLYFFALICIAAAAMLLIAPSIHHRLLFRLKQRAYLVSTGNAMLIAGCAFLSVGMTAILVLISDVIFGALAAVIVGVLTASVVGGLWFAMPLMRRREVRDCGAADYGPVARGK
jgi:hypothetical protein